ncbi:MAG: T9SS type A sorting domain-containing protein [Lentimicrobium sp.]
MRTICSLPDELIESSGIGIEGSNRIWSHEDSGNSNEISCFDTTGTLLHTITISNVENIDWEDLATDNEETWYICDAGNNNNNRTDLAVYIIPDPETMAGNQVIAGIINFILEDQTEFPPPSSDRNYDIEAMAWHDDSLFMFTKDRSNPFTGITKMYVLPDNPGTYTARLAGSYYIGNTTESGRITSANINHHTGELILLTNTGLVSFTNYPGNRFFDGEVTKYNFTTIPGQNEAIAFVSAETLYMTEEGSNNAAGFIYEIMLPQPQLTADMPDTDNLLKAYPNPFQDVIRIQCPVNGAALLEVIDCEGRVIKNSIFNHEATWYPDDLKPGVYTICLTSGGVRI